MAQTKPKSKTTPGQEQGDWQYDFHNLPPNLRVIACSFTFQLSVILIVGDALGGLVRTGMYQARMDILVRICKKCGGSDVFGYILDQEGNCDHRYTREFRMLLGVQEKTKNECMEKLEQEAEEFLNTEYGKGIKR